MNCKFRNICLSLTMIVGLVGISQAMDSRLTLGPRLAFYDSNDGDGTWFGGVQTRFFLSEGLAIEGSVDYRNEKFGNTDVETIPVQASVLPYFIATGPLRIFGIAGIGYYFTRVDPDGPFDDDTENRFGLQAGFGAEYIINDWWSLDGTYRYTWLEEFSTQESSILKKDFDDSGNMVSFALNYRFH